MPNYDREILVEAHTKARIPCELNNVTSLRWYKDNEVSTLNFGRIIQDSNDNAQKNNYSNNKYIPIYYIAGICPAVGHHKQKPVNNNNIYF